jgi:hypothetical protein
LTSVASAQNSAPCRISSTLGRKLLYRPFWVSLTHERSLMTVRALVCSRAAYYWYQKASGIAGILITAPSMRFHTFSLNLKSVKQKILCNRATLSLIGWPLTIKGFRINNTAGVRESAYSCKNLWNVQTNRKCSWLPLFYATRLFITHIWKNMPTWAKL